jgi:hypothetical protein
VNKNSRIQSTGAKNRLIEKTISEHLGDLYAVLRTKFQAGCELFKEQKLVLENGIAYQRQSIKNEVDLKIESIHEEVEIIRKKLFYDVDKYCETALQ